MIRFKTVEPDKAETSPAKPVVQEVVAAVPAIEPDLAEPDAPAAKTKGLTRKTPLRAKKPATGLFES